MKNVFNIDIQDENLGSAGVNWGSTDFEGGEAEFVVELAP